MTDPISVPNGFKDDFDLVCDRAGMDWRDKNEYRDMVRLDFAVLGAHIQEQAAIYRYCDSVYGVGVLPTPAQCEAFLARKGRYPEDGTIFRRWGIMLLARECAIVAGALQGEPAIV